MKTFKNLVFCPRRNLHMKVHCFSLVISRALNFENAPVNMFAQCSLRTLYCCDVSSCPTLHLFYSLVYSVTFSHVALQLDSNPTFS